MRVRFIGLTNIKDLSCLYSKYGVAKSHVAEKQKIQKKTLRNSMLSKVDRRLVRPMVRADLSFGEDRTMNHKRSAEQKGLHFIVLFAPTIMVLPASKLVCWFHNSSASGFVVTCCDRCYVRFAAASRRDDWLGAWRWVW